MYNQFTMKLPIVFIISAILCITANADTLKGKVVKVSDGDTITVLDSSKTQHRIRLTGIDAPESKQAFGEKSRQSLASLVAGQTVAVQWESKDRYGRILGKVVTQGNQDANLAQVQRGMAWHYEKFANTRPKKESKAYAVAQEEAKAKSLGLWTDKNPIPPWEWRRKNK